MDALNETETNLDEADGFPQYYERREIRLPGMPDTDQNPLRRKTPLVPTRKDASRLKWLRTALILILFPAFPATGDQITFPFGTFNYDLEGGLVTITSGGVHPTNGSQAIQVPATINGHPVVKIGDYAFASSKMTSISLPNNIASIGEGAFLACDYLTNAHIPNEITDDAGRAVGLQTLGEKAFSGCLALQNVNLPRTLREIGPRAFAYCASLTVMTVPPKVVDLGDDAFTNCSGLETINLQEGVISIGERAFESCGNLATVGLPTTLQRIGRFAFYDCLALKSVALPASAMDLQEAAFRASGLLSVTLPAGITHIGSDLFAECTYLKDPVIPYGVIHIGRGAFYECTSITRMTIPGSVRSIGELAFYGCSKLGEVRFFGDAPTLGSKVFAGVPHKGLQYDESKRGFSWPDWLDYTTRKMGPQISVSLYGESELRDERSRMAFGTAVIGTSGLSRTLLLKSVGTQTLGNLQFKVVGPGANDFTVTPNLRDSGLAIDKSLKIVVKFQPISKGIRRAVLIIRSNDARENPFEIDLSGFSRRVTRFTPGR